MTASHRVRPRRTLTLTISFRIFMLAVAVFAAVIGWVLFLVIDANASLNTYVKNAHAQRVLNQADTQKQIRELACAVVKPFPDTSGDLIKGLRARYHCPPFDPANAPKSAATKSAATTSKPSHSPVRGAALPKVGTTTSRTVVIAVGRPTVSTTRTVHVPQPNPTHTATPHPTTKPTTTSAAPQPRPTVILHLGESTCTVGVLSVCVIGG